MIVDKESICYKYCPTRYLNFEQFNWIRDDIYLIPSYTDYSKLKKIKNKKVVLIEYEEPTRFFVKDNNFNHDIYEDYFYKIFTLCPYTADYLNKKYNNLKREQCFFPFNKELIPKNFKKEYDIIYTWNIVHKTIIDYINIIKRYNYRFVSWSKSNLITDNNVDNKLKYELIAKSKITLCHNLLFLNRNHIINLYLNHKEQLKNNKALSEINILNLLTWKWISTMVKSRVFEAAFCKSLMLVQKDKWNLIEKFFKPNVDFIYFENKKDLDNKIKEILFNYKKYEYIIENAYNKAINNYTTKHFFEKYLQNLE